MDPYNFSDLVSEIRNLIGSGISKEHIYSSLIAREIPVDDIAKAYNVAASFNASSQASATIPSPLASPLKTESPESKEDTSARAVRTIVTIGAIMVALGIFIFIATNWEHMSSAFKVIILLASMIVSYGLGWFFEYRTEQEMLGKALIFLGALIYGATIFLVAQIFNIRANWPDGFMLWMFGVFLIAYTERSDGLKVLAIVLAFLGAGGYAFISGNLFFGDPAFYSSNFILILSAATLFIAGVRVRRRVDLTSVPHY